MHIVAPPEDPVVAERRARRPAHAALPELRRVVGHVPRARL